MSVLARTTTIPWGDPGISMTLEEMSRLATKGAKHAPLILWAQDAIRHVPARDVDGEAKAIYDAVRRSFRYTKDPVHAELVKSPEVLLNEIQRNGVAQDDCDGYVVFLIACLEAVGILAQPVVISQDQGTFTHVLVRYQSPRRGWVALDAITSNPVGWFPKNVKRVGVFDDGRISTTPADSFAGWNKGGSKALVRAPTTAAPLRGHAMTRSPAYASPQPYLKGMCGDCDCSTPCSGAPTDPFARASGRLKPYSDLMWFAWAAVSLWAARKHIFGRR